jgi:hypothetical protein
MFSTPSSDLRLRKYPKKGGCVMVATPIPWVEFAHILPQKRDNITNLILGL